MCRQGVLSGYLTFPGGKPEELSLRISMEIDEGIRQFPFLCGLLTEGLRMRLGVGV